VIDIQPDNSIALFFGLPGYSENDLIIKAGETKLMNKGTSRLIEPVGVEMFKLIASEKQLDLSPIETQKPAINRQGPVTEFEDMLNKLYDSNQIRSMPGNFSKISIYTKTITILEN